MKMSKPDDHHDRHDNRNADRTDGMGIEDLQQFDIGRQDRDQISLILPVQLRRSQSPKCAKYPIPYQCQQTECNIMVPVLLCIMKNTSKHRNHD